MSDTTMLVNKSPVEHTNSVEYVKDLVDLGELTSYHPSDGEDEDKDEDDDIDDEDDEEYDFI